MNNDLISREALKKALKSSCDLCNDKNTNWCEHCCPLNDFEDLIDNAPTVEYTFEEAFQKTVCEQRLYCPKRLQGEREFIEILARYVPDDICTYPEYRGKPYYSIHYKENGEEFVGFSTYKPEVLSRYLKDYFLKGGIV